MRVLLIDHGCRGQGRVGKAASCPHPDADKLSSLGVMVTVAEASEVFPDDAAGLAEDVLADAREAARRAIDLAVDGENPDVILVLHAGAIADLAVETGVPVVVHVAVADLAAAGVEGPVRDLVASSLCAADVIAADDEATARLLVEEGWTFGDARIEMVPTGNAQELIAACRRAIKLRRG